MAINPLQAPINYMGMMPQVDLGQQFAEFGQALAQRQERIKKQEMQQQYAQDLQNAIANPTQQTWLNMVAKYPSQREAFESVRKGYGDQRLQNEFNQGFSVSLALENNNPEVAKAELQKIITARKNSNEPTQIYQQIYDAIEAGNITSAQAGVNMALTVADPERYQKAVEAQIKAKQAPSLIEQEKAKLEETAAKTALDIAKTETEKAAKLAPAVREAIDYQNLTPEQKAIFQNIQQLKKPPAAVTNVNVTNLEKTASGELAKLIPDLYERANSAAAQVEQIPRYKNALKSAITGPFADQRLSAARISSALGFTGEKGINATREVIQGLSEMALQSRGMLTGQGSITNEEQRLLIQARSGDINFTRGELETLLNVAERASRAQYNKSVNLMKSASGKSETVQMFLDNVSELPSEQQQQPPATATAMPQGFRVIR